MGHWMFLKISRHITNANFLVFIDLSIPQGFFGWRVPPVGPESRTIVLVLARRSEAKKSKGIGAQPVFSDRFNQVIAVGLKAVPLAKMQFRLDTKTVEPH